jgi:hypothetical protein
MDITPCGEAKQPPTKEKNLKTFSPRKDYVSLTTVLIHIYILGMGLIQLLIANDITVSLNFKIGISDHFHLTISPAHLFVPEPVSFVILECNLSRIMGK